VNRARVFADVATRNVRHLEEAVNHLSDARLSLSLAGESSAFEVGAQLTNAQKALERERNIAKRAAADADRIESKERLEAATKETT